MGVGLQNNGVVREVEELDSRANELQGRIEALKKFMSSGDSLELARKSSPADMERGHPTPVSLPVLSDEEFELFINQIGPQLKSKMNEFKIQLAALDADYSLNEGLKLLIDEPDEALRQMRSGDFYPTIWNDFEGYVSHQRVKMLEE